MDHVEKQGERGNHKSTWRRRRPQRSSLNIGGSGSATHVSFVSFTHALLREASGLTGIAKPLLEGACEILGAIPVHKVASTSKRVASEIHVHQVFGALVRAGDHAICHVDNRRKLCAVKPLRASSFKFLAHIVRIAAHCATIVAVSTLPAQRKTRLHSVRTATPTSRRHAFGNCQLNKHKHITQLELQTTTSTSLYCNDLCGFGTKKQFDCSTTFQ